MSIVTCPKCGAINPVDAMNCKNCRINLKFALEHPDMFTLERRKKATTLNESHIDIDTCWFCGKRAADTSATLNVKMYGNVVRVPMGNQTRVQWQSLTVSIPRCETCKSGHEKVNTIWGIATVIGLIVSIPIVLNLGSSFFDSYNGPIPVCIPLNIAGLLFVLGVLALPFIGIASVFGLIGKSIGKALLPPGTRSEESKSQFPVIAVLLKQGWEIGDKPPR